MKVTMQLKDLDGIGDAIEDTTEKETSNLIHPKVMEDYPTAFISVREEILQTISNKLDKWVKYGDYVTIEFDLDTMTAKVLEAK